MNGEPARAGLTILGAVQGVGFRPFLFRLAAELGLRGWVANFPGGVLVEVEGGRVPVERFIFRIAPEKPEHSFIQSLETRWMEPVGFSGFEIRESIGTGEKTALILPDIATCPDCVREIFDPENRRYFYPFTNCTRCGPRFSIIEGLPYDRANTSMREFEMCTECRAEYENPEDRRFHAQPNACPVCGPQIRLSGASESFQHGLVKGKEALSGAAEAICSGQILAVKGLGGFQLMCDARSETAMRRLRELKHREEKPFALMFPTLASVKLSCEISELEERLLLSSEAPIVLLRRKSSRLCNEDHRPGDFNPEFEIPPAVAPGNSYLGVMLPYTPLHHLLMHLLEFPVVATSGNLADEPICTDEHEAFERLGKIADRFLVHNRPIVRPVDDSIVRTMAGREMVLRRARGFAPLPVPAGPAQRVPEGGLQSTTPVLLAVGAHLKNSVALGIGNQVFVSQHIGDLETASAFHAFKSVIADLQRLHEVEPEMIAVDAHPDYLSTKFARMTSKVRVVEVQHHHAHVLSCMADNELDGPVLGVVWDGSGFGPDGTLWGGEFLKVSGGAFERMGHFRNFQLPGGDSAIREPRRSAAGLLFEIFGDDFPAEIRKTPGPEMFSPNELGTLATMLRKRLNAPSTSSVGRLFDAVASLVNLRQRAGFEGQAAMDLEFALEGVETEQAYPSLILTKDGPLVLDWQPMILKILADLQNGVPAGEISAKFHNGLVDVIVTVAHRAGEKRVVMTGGCFQNRYLTERAVRRLSEEGFEPVWHQRIPPNDGGIAVGQIAAVHYTIDGTSSSAASEYKR